MAAVDRRHISISSSEIEHLLQRIEANTARADDHP